MAVLNRNSFSSLGDSEIAVVVVDAEDDSSEFSKTQVVVGFEEEEEVDDGDVMISLPDKEKDVNAVVVGVVIQPATTTNQKILVGFKRAAGTAILIYLSPKTRTVASRKMK